MENPFPNDPIGEMVKNIPPPISPAFNPPPPPLNDAPLPKPAPKTPHSPFGA